MANGQNHIYDRGNRPPREALRARIDKTPLCNGNAIRLNEDETPYCNFSGNGSLPKCFYLGRESVLANEDRVYTICTRLDNKKINSRAPIALQSSR